MTPDRQTPPLRPTEPRLGVHLSLGRKPASSVAAAAAHGARCIQIFASSPGAWKPPVFSNPRLAELALARREHDVNPLFIHAVYLINLASPDSGQVARSRDSLVATLAAGPALNAVGVVTHLGSHLGRGFAAVAEQVAAVLVEILAAAPVSVDLILENSAGSGGNIGSRLEELGTLIRLAGSHPRLKVCLDTAHLFAAGWNFTDAGVAQQLVGMMAAEIGLDRLTLIHVNDSRAPCASNRDRHAIIGEGHIGLAGFRALLNQAEFRAVPWILETPDLGLEQGDARRFSSLRILNTLTNKHRPKTSRALLESQALYHDGGAEGRHIAAFEIAEERA